ncbi:hypothetical protein RSO41_05860 [Halomonas sp. I1]|uniref:hypothetical protein n=1 Tax=Halomonas sp. I1 TaxID=393536 RepID=UPI0028DF3E88|nr:hypothetical protein [Halomonas sp. I1]MDT8894174.1 hypothetical protein [Halomonas sp. I1]
MNDAHVAGNTIAHAAVLRQLVKQTYNEKGSDEAQAIYNAARKILERMNDGDLKNEAMAELHGIFDGMASSASE